MVAEYRKGFACVINRIWNRTVCYQVTLRMASRKDREPKLGKPIYSYTLYEKVQQATIPLDSEQYLRMPFLKL